VGDPELVLYAVAEGVATLTWNRPERNNGWTYALERRYFELLDRAAADPEVRAIVVTGAGRSFCPGLDFEQLRRAVGDAGVWEERRPQTHPLRIPKPIIAAINGACAGIGLVQALVCDLRFAARGARFTTAYARRGLVAEHGISRLLPALIGIERSLDLLLSARVFEADEAQRLGLVSRVLEPAELLGAATAYARELARFCSPAAMAAIKRQVWRDAGRDLEAVRADAIELMQRHSSHPDFGEGVASFSEKRDPRFQPLPPDYALRLPGEDELE
jgi:enoyl-CoA hydratase/carnithine racemase